jgi:flagellin-specific chaperone FliS
MRDIILPPHHLYIAQSCYRLSILYEELHQYDVALEYAQRALTIYGEKPQQNQKSIRKVQDIIDRLKNDLTIS